MILNMILAHRDDRFQVAVNEQMDRKQAHGTFKIQDDQGAVRTVPFQVDYPQRIQTPTQEQVKKLFQQIDQLGYKAEVVLIGRGMRVKSYRRTHFA